MCNKKKSAIKTYIIMLKRSLSAIFDINKTHEDVTIMCFGAATSRR